MAQFSDCLRRSRIALSLLPVPGDTVRSLMITSTGFRTAYALHRAAEGRGSGGEGELLSLPYLRQGGLSRQWAVRARSYECFMKTVVAPLARELQRPLRVLDLGAGNGWLCFRLAREGHSPLALDWRRDTVDGLGAGGRYRAHLPRMFARVAASFEDLPIKTRFDVVVFNAALHYTVNLRRTLQLAAQVTRPGGRVVVLDSPFYQRESDGERMVAEKRRAMLREAGPRAAELLALPAIEYLTPARLADASTGTPLTWNHRRVRYPIWYELRAILARLRRRRPPSRFDLWEASVP